MKILNIIIILLILLLLLSGRLIAQDLNIYNMIGKKLNYVIKVYGKPIHQDKSNPEMICTFYKGNDGTMSFVSNKKGVYQAETYKSYSSPGKARSEIDKSISKAISNGYKCDTVSVNDFQLIKKGVKSTLQANDNKITHKTDVHAKAVRTEG
ncbi:MAG: hypothetical protein P8Z35_04970 [Ignavibacteriaceae bacterium]|jgi:hypothetical protein